MNVKRFLIPEGDMFVMLKLVESIPLDWSFVNGRLNAPAQLIATRQAVAGTGLFLSRSHSIRPTFIGETAWDREKQEPDLYAVLALRRLPGFIRFDDAGYQEQLMTLTLARRIAMVYIKYGYRGTLSFYSNCSIDDRSDNEARCELALEPWHGAPFLREEAGDQPARIKLEWRRDSRGERRIAPILRACEVLALREYEPAART
ncbi:hypothetical protein C4552_04200 [Candidatus Parcubacteria bacterium]|nr:MAG: hypothetical protein C4552_04200 [Candidatus Parcubacteria bacterium]